MVSLVSCFGNVLRKKKSPQERGNVLLESSLEERTKTALQKAKKEYQTVQEANFKSNGSLEIFIYELANPYLSPKKEGKENASRGYNEKISKKLKNWALKVRAKSKAEYSARKAVLKNDYGSFFQICYRKGIRDKWKIDKLFEKGRQRVGKMIEESLSKKAKRQFGLLYSSIRTSHSFEDYLRSNYFERAGRMGRLKDLGDRGMTRHGEFSKNYLREIRIQFDLKKVA